jgi:hypothetical protein
MFTLRDDHVRALRASFMETLAERCAAHLRTDVEWAVHAISDSILQRMVWASIRRAQGAGLRMDTAIIAYVHLAFVVAPNFDAHPLVRRVAATGVTPDDLPYVLGERLSPADWREVRTISDPACWQLREPG